MRKQLAALVIAGTAVAGMVVAPDAKASDTTTTFTLNAAGGLSISAPASKNLSAGTATGTASLSATLGNVTATDQRGALLGSWTATAVSTDFTTGGASANETITADNVTYDSGLVTPSGVVVAVGTIGAVAIDEAADVVTGTATVGNNSATWNPTIAVSIPSDAVTGTYTGTITHSLA